MPSPTKPARGSAHRPLLLSVSSSSQLIDDATAAKLRSRIVARESLRELKGLSGPEREVLADLRDEAGEDRKPFWNALLDLDAELASAEGGVH